MKKHWRRGLLLGVSIALLLSGGVALAASLSVEANQPCFECVARADWPPSGDQLMELTFGGYDPGEDLFARLTMAGSLWGEGSYPSPLRAPPAGFNCPYVAKTSLLACSITAMHPIIQQDSMRRLAHPMVRTQCTASGFGGYSKVATPTRSASSSRRSARWSSSPNQAPSCSWAAV